MFLTGHKSFANIRLYERLGYRVFRTDTVSPALSLVFMEKMRHGMKPESSICGGVHAVVQGGPELSAWGRD